MAHDDRLEIVCDNVFPPVPSRNFDWCAYIDGAEESGRYGWGATKWEAVRQLIDTLEEAEDG